MPEFLKDWSGYILAAIAGAAGILFGLKRSQITTEMRLTQIEQDLRQIRENMDRDAVAFEARIKAAELHDRDGAILMARIQASLDNVLEYLADLKAEIRGKK